MQGAAVGSINCGISTVVKKLAKLRNRGGLAAIARATRLTATERLGKSKGACKLAGYAAMSAAQMAVIASQDHPVYVSEIRRRNHRDHQLDDDLHVARRLDSH